MLNDFEVYKLCCYLTSKTPHIHTDFGDYLCIPGTSIPRFIPSSGTYISGTQEFIEYIFHSIQILSFYVLTSGQRWSLLDMIYAIDEHIAHLVALTCDGTEIIWSLSFCLEPLLKLKLIPSSHEIIQSISRNLYRDFTKYFIKDALNSWREQEYTR